MRCLAGRPGCWETVGAVPFTTKSHRKAWLPSPAHASTQSTPNTAHTWPARNRCPAAAPAPPRAGSAAAGPAAPRPCQRRWRSPSQPCPFQSCSGGCPAASAAAALLLSQQRLLPSGSVAAPGRLRAGPAPPTQPAAAPLWVVCPRRLPPGPLLLLLQPPAPLLLAQVPRSRRRCGRTCAAGAPAGGPACCRWQTAAAPCMPAHKGLFETAGPLGSLPPGTMG